jgi:ribonuclease HIII
MKSSYVANLDLKAAKQLSADLKEKGFEFSHPPHTQFSAKTKGISCTLYNSGKLVVQGKEMAEFIEFYLEPEILQAFNLGYEELAIDQTPRIGIDESGKGDFFGALCVAGVYAQGNELAKLKALGVQDSKKISDASILKIGKKIKEEFAHHIIKINPKKYNEIYSQFKNLNSLLAWGHATTIEQLVQKTDCHNVIIDQFANERVVITALKRKKIEVKLTQRHRAEEDLIVAAASILARQTFLESLDALSKEFGVHLPKGASATCISIGKTLVGKYGKEVLPLVAKMHFKTLDAIIH